MAHIGTFLTGHVVTAAEMNALGPYWTSGAGAPAGTGASGDLYLDLTNKRGYRSDGVGWIIMFEPPQSYTPTFTQSGAVTKTTTNATYQRCDGWIRIQVLLAATGAGTAANPVVVGTPVALEHFANFNICGVGGVYDASVTTFYPGHAATGSTTTIIFWGPTTTGANLGQGVFTAALASGDAVFMNINARMDTAYL